MKIKTSGFTMDIDETEKGWSVRFRSLDLPDFLDEDHESQEEAIAAAANKIKSLIQEKRSRLQKQVDRLDQMRDDLISIISYQLSEQFKGDRHD